MKEFQKKFQKKFQKNIQKNKQEELTQEQLALQRKVKVHRNREIALAILLIFLVFIGTWGQTTYFGSDSWYFLILLNLNAILMLVVFYLTARNVIILISERRRKVFGSRLRTRLLLAFGSLSLIPVVLMFLAANRVVITSIDYWFTRTVASSMEAALEVGQNIYETSTERLLERVEYINSEINQFKSIQKNISQEEAERLKDNYIEKYLNRVQHILNGNILIHIKYENSTVRLVSAFPQSRETSIFIQNTIHSISWESLYKDLNNEGYVSLVGVELENEDYTIAVKALYPQSKDFIIIAERIGSVAQSNLQAISAGFEEYTYLKSLTRPLKLSFSLILGLLGLIMIFSSIFMAFRLSKELTAPIEALAEGADRMAHGELDIKLKDSGKDELGQLVESFNSMVTQVSTTNKSIRNANSQLAQRNIFIENVLENIDTGVCVLNSEGAIISINKAVGEIFNINFNHWLNKDPLELFQQRERELFYVMLSFLKENPEKRWRKEIELTRGTLSLKLRIMAQTLPNFSTQDTQENNIIVIIEDISELTRIERLAAWREVAKRIAHEMKNPLTPIRLSAERLQRKFNTNEDPIFSECTRLITNEVTRMQEMIKSFTNFSQMPEVILEKQDLLAIIKDSLQIFKASYTDIKWDLELSHNRENIPLLLHAKTLKQVLINIYLNASEVLKNKENAQVITRIEFQEKKCKVIIADNGIGLSEDSMKQIFEPYYSNKKDGTGLGLAIAQSIITEHNATIHAEQNEFGGTSIVITFPD